MGSNQDYMRTTISLLGRKDLKYDVSRAIIGLLGDEKIEELVRQGDLTISKIHWRLDLPLSVKLSIIQGAKTITIEEVEKDYCTMLNHTRREYKWEVLIAILRRIREVTDHQKIAFNRIRNFVHVWQSAMKIPVFTEEKDIDLFLFYFDRTNAKELVSSELLAKLSLHSGER